MIRKVVPADASQICKIYNYYVENTTISFEEESVPVQEMETRIINVTERLPWYVFCEKEEVLGYAYASPWRTRIAYRFSVESSVYVGLGYSGKGIGSSLYRKLLEELKNQGYHLVIGGITLPNNSSTSLHEKFGFKKVAHFREVGFKLGNWLDVGYWEKNLEEK
jgi:phosphinothricin acetyltransferase